MATSFGALCTDFYINQKLAMKMDLPCDRETVLHLFDRVRKSVPNMDRFRRYEGELALESSRRNEEYRWLALRRTSIRTGHVNPESLADAYKFHRLILDVAPHHLTVSPLDIDYVELLFGFDLECKANHDQIVYDALVANSPTAMLFSETDAKVLDVQPIYGLQLTEKGDLQAYFEVKTRAKTRRGNSGRHKDEPISIFLTMRKYGPVHHVDQLQEIFEGLSHQAEALVAERLVPGLLQPISRQIASSNA